MKIHYLAGMLTAACGLACSSAPAGPGVANPAHAARALDRAEVAFVSGDYHQSVDETAPVIRGRSTPRQRYSALKLRALAECRAEESPASTGLARELAPNDRQLVRELCAAETRYPSVP